MKKSDKMRKLMAELASDKKPAKKAKPKKKKEEKKEKKADAEAADVNKDGKVDEKDLSIVHKAYSSVKKRIKKKKDE